MKSLTSWIVDGPQGLTEEWFTAVLREGGTITGDAR